MGLGTNFTWHGHLDMVTVPYYMEEAAAAPASRKAPAAMQAEATSGPQDAAAETDETALTAVAVSTVQEEEEEEEKEEEEEEDLGDSSPGENSLLEMKRGSFSDSNISQLIGETVFFNRPKQQTRG